MASRRRVLASTATAVTIGVAGCATDTTEPNGESDGSDGGVDPYEVCIEPSGCHTFEEVPESFFVIPGTQEDMAMSLGLQPAAHAYPERKPYKFYDQLPGVDYDPDDVFQYGEGESARNYDREIFYEIDPDVILADPRMLQNYSNWSDADMDEIETAVAPFLGSYIRFDFEGQEPHYTMYELFEKVADLFQRQAQYEAWVELHDEFMERIEDRLPPEDERPTAAVFWRGINADAGEFQPAPISEKRNDVQCFRDLGIKDAFQGMDIAGDIGYETLLDVDPDYIAALTLSSMTGDEWQREVVDPLEDHSTARRLSAVESGNVVRSSGQFMGPVTHLFSTEALAKQVYPDQFGSWPGDSDAIPESEQLFDRERVAEIVTGDH
ncbi:ABC transporter substrate-binding protein [Natrialba sp. SSL1]|uniref:ABC transporter substrate-binding protein n=1 Tax=Natrialba sp. SSL1 TaxID=1869245 RepID=UPI0008F91956|nr:ABC transporter substrate-binding protein [Natrialba sp. SSL1]OIB58232.1 ferrichrome ABC transporter substrate-binding protein [Natrialba sp. SSL1]